jgi:hypothetical protein
MNNINARQKSYEEYLIKNSTLYKLKESFNWNSLINDVKGELYEKGLLMFGDPTPFMFGEYGLCNFGNVVIDGRLFYIMIPNNKIEEVCRLNKNNINILTNNDPTWLKLNLVNLLIKQ